MTNLRKVAQAVRHLPGLERLDSLWRILRPVYHGVLNAGGNGVKVFVGDCAPVRMPAEFAGVSWERYEPDAVAAFAHWIRQHPGAFVLDVGSSIGIFSVVALHADARTEVVAFDSDLASLAASRRVCQYASGERLRVVLGFLSEKCTVVSSLAHALTATNEVLARSGVRGDIGTTRYVCLADANIGAIPSYRLDDLFALEALEGREVLIKCDVEGAELLVLRGAETFLRRTASALLISVHPSALPEYGHSKEEVAVFLGSLGYQIEVIAVDHEEHWWCQRPA